MTSATATTAVAIEAEHEQQRQAQIAVKAAFIAEFIQLWPALEWDDLDGSYPTWSHLVMKLIRHWRQVSADLALKQYGELRLLAAPKAMEVPAPVITFGPDHGVADVRNIDWSEDDRLAELALKITGPDEIKRQIGLGQDQRQIMDRALVRTSGSASRQVLLGDRVTTLTAVDADTQAVGWARISDGNPCAFCWMLVSRGPVYKSEATANFQAHDHCGCKPVPVFSKSAPWPGRAREYRRIYNQVAQGQPDPLNAIRRYLATQESDTQADTEAA